jgi:hypothetical protein
MHARICTLPCAIPVWRKPVSWNGIIAVLDLSNKRKEMEGVSGSCCRSWCEIRCLRYNQTPLSE